MKTIGLIGGISWLSTVDYYRLINEGINKHFGGVHSARILLYSVNYAEIKAWTELGRWDLISDYMAVTAKKLETAGADCLLLGANTMHKIADEVQALVNIPVIHIAEAVAESIKAKGIRKVALIGTKYTMQLDFYKERLSRSGIDTIIPNPDEIELINDAIYNELGRGIFLPATKQFFLKVMHRLAAEGAEGIILGCTEIPILIKPEDCELVMFDSTQIHATVAVKFAIS